MHKSHTVDLEHTFCAVCGADNTTLLFEGKDAWFNLPGQFPLHQCAECGLIYINPRPSPTKIAFYYPAEYTPYQPGLSDIPSRLKRWDLRYGIQKRVRAIQKRVRKKGHVLDVGCATGNLLHALRKEGWKTSGVELNQAAAEYARSVQKLNVYTGTLEDAPIANESFDLIIFWDVLEHVHDPRQSLSIANQLSKPGGSLIVSLPNPDSVDAKLFGQYWAGWDIPRHLNIFPKAVIKRLLKETGWEVTDTICMGGRHWLFNLSLEHFLKERLNNNVARHFLLRVARSLPVRILTLPYFVLVEKLNKGSIMAIFAERK